MDSYWIYSDIDLVRQFVEQIGDTKAWMADQGSIFDWGTTCNTLIGCMWQRINTFVGGTVDGVEDDSKYGCYFAVPINTVLKANEANEVMYRTIAKSLITDDTGRVTGVTCEMYDGTPVTLHANKAVILATGGYGANIDMVLETNEYWNKDELSANILTTNRSLAQGEGITMAQEVGAAVTGMGFTQLMPLGWADDGKLAGGKGEDVIFVSPAGTENEGKRFVDESAERDVLSQGQLTYGGENGLTIQLQNGGEHTSADNREGKEYFCTLAEAAELTGISADTLRETIMEYDTAYFNGDLASLDVPKSAAAPPSATTTRTAASTTRASCLSVTWPPAPITPWAAWWWMSSAISSPRTAASSPACTRPARSPAVSSPATVWAATPSARSWFPAVSPARPPRRNKAFPKSLT